MVFEEINYAGDGGLYPELIRNQAFMDPATPARWVAPAGLPRVPDKSGSALQSQVSGASTITTLAAALIDWMVPGPASHEAEQLPSPEPTVPQTVG